MENSYPKISLPTKYRQILVSDPPLPAPPKEPDKPQEPIKPTPSSGEGCMPTGFVLVFLGLMMLGLYFAANREDTGDLTFVSVCGILGAIGILYFNYSSHNYDKKKYPERLRNYQLDIGKYNTAIKDYEVFKKNYLQKLAQHNANIEVLMSPENVRRHRLGLLNKFNKEITPPMRRELVVTKGASENFFFNHLNKHFNTVYQNKVLNQDELNLFPDFTYINDEDNLIIDIEIDEPYVGSNGNPIHHTESNDIWRDDYFNQHGWAVIRFTEEQVITQPYNCCQFIKIFIQQYLRLEIINKDKLTRSTVIKPIPTWTKEESHRLAYRRYRFSYLPPNLQAKIKDENFDSHLTVEDEIINKWRRKNNPYEDDLPF